MNLGVEMEISQRMAAAYDRVAAEFAEKNAIMPPGYLEIGPRFLALVRSGRAVLDVGCGAGRDLAWLAERGASVVGGDRSAGMLAQARQLVRANQHGPGRLLQLDMRGLPFGGAVFGGVWCSASLLHLPKADAPGALAEMYRVLTPGGPLLLGIQEGDSEGWEPSPYDVPVERFFARYRQDEAEAMLGAAGFEILERRTDVAPNRRWLTFLAARAT
jgi:ubiquinone/menaquinone biosynthesis C-methylase UbiE